MAPPADASAFLGFDHVDTRVADLRRAEPFYDRLMPRLGLAKKVYAYVDPAGAWFFSGYERYNAVEYHEATPASGADRFIGFIEDAPAVPSRTRIAFRLAELDDLAGWVRFLAGAGALDIEPSADMAGYPAIFFTDPCGTKLELCARPVV